MAEAVGTRASLLCVAVASALLSLFFPLLRAQSAATLVPAVIIFGDSSMDVGNNNHLPATFKANFQPYGRNFTNHTPTGRFCDGKMVTDFTAETLGFTSFAPAYLSPQAAGENLLLGANFASAGSGYYEETSNMYNALSLGKQLEYYKEYRVKLEEVAGKSKAAAILTGAMYLLGTGNADFLQSYYINSSFQKRYARGEFSSLLTRRFANFVKDLHGLGARRIGVTSLPPLGCFPAPINLYGHGSAACVPRINADARAFNQQLNATANKLSRELPGLTLVVFDIYNPLMELFNSPSKHGFVEARKGCCQTGTSRASVLCKRSLVGVCSNADKYVFWDGVHPSQAANLVIAQSVMLQGIALLP